MKKLIRLLMAMIMCLTSLFTVACTQTPPETPPEEPDPNLGPKMTFDESLVEHVQWLGIFTGKNSFNGDIYKEVNIGGTDLGYPMYNSKTEEMWLFFGDTFETKMSGMWRSNTCAITTDFDLSDNLTINDYLRYKEGGMAKDIAPSKHIDKDERTKIPTGAIEIDGTVYMFFFSKYAWPANGVAREDSMNYGGCVKSTDNGKTWTKVNQLSWADHDEGGKQGSNLGNSAERIQVLMEQDINNITQDDAMTVDIHQHYGHDFTSIYPVDGKDGYIYIFGEGGYRSQGIKLGRVLKEEFEDFEAYEYMNGTDALGNPIWLKGSAGLRTVCENDDAFLTSGGCGEHSVVWNSYLEAWTICYTKSGVGVVMNVGPNIWGPYSRDIILIRSSYPYPNKDGSIYGGWTHEMWQEEDGRIFYFVMSQYNIAYNSSIVKVTLW